MDKEKLKKTLWYGICVTFITVAGMSIIYYVSTGGL